MKLEDFNGETQERIKDLLAIQVANVEQSSSNEQVAKKETPRFDRPVSLTLFSKRYRLTDSDGACAKYVIDSIVSAKVLVDDNVSCIPEAPKRIQEKISKDQQEETIITIKEI